MRGRARGVLAAVLSLLAVLGLGDVYNGETRKGISLFALALAVNLGGLVALGLLLATAPSAWALVAYVPVLLALVGMCMDAGRSTERAASPAPR